MRKLLTRDDVRTMDRNGETPTDILSEAITSGLEYPDAEWLVRNTLRMTDEEVDEMRDNYMTRS